MNTWAVYKGIKYDASFHTKNEIILRTFDKKALKLNFYEKQYPNGKTIYIKHVDKSELDELYDEHEFGTWHGMEFRINGGTETEHTIWFWFNDYNDPDYKKCMKYNMDTYDKGVLVKSVPKSEITNYRIEREDLLHK